MTGEDACPTTQNQRFTLDVGQASWPVDAFFSSLPVRVDDTFGGWPEIRFRAARVSMRQADLRRAVTSHFFVAPPKGEYYRAVKCPVR